MRVTQLVGRACQLVCFPRHPGHRRTGTDHPPRHHQRKPLPHTETAPFIPSGNPHSCRKTQKINGRKRHIAVDTTGLLLAVVVTVANIQDRDGAVRLLAALAARLSSVRLVWADGGYARRLIVWAKYVLALTVHVVKRNDDTTGFEVLPLRWVMERTFAWVSKHRRCVRDYKIHPAHHEAIVYFAMIMIMSRRLGRLS